MSIFELSYSALPNMKSAAEMCADMAKRNKTKVTLFHVTNAIPSMDSELEQLDENLADMPKTESSVARNIRAQAAMMRSAGIETQIELRHGLPIEGILHALDSEDYQLLILGDREQNIFDRFISDETTHKIIDIASCPVLFVKKLNPLRQNMK